MAPLMAALARELDYWAVEVQALQPLLGELSMERALSPEQMRRAQSVDALHQHLHQLAAFCAGLSRAPLAVADAGTAAAILSAADELDLADLAARLTSAGELCRPRAADCEIW